MVSMLVSSAAANPTIAPCLAGRRGVGLQQDACLQQLTGGGFALLDQHIEPSTLLGGKLDDVLLDGRLLRAHDTSPELPERPIQRSAAVSTTGGTSSPSPTYECGVLPPDPKQTPHSQQLPRCHCRSVGNARARPTWPHTAASRR